MHAVVMLMFHFALAQGGAPVYAELVGPVSAAQCARVASVYRAARPDSGRNDVACMPAPSATQWLQQASCTMAGPGQGIPNSSVTRWRYLCAG